MTAAVCAAEFCLKSTTMAPGCRAAARGRRRGCRDGGKVKSWAVFTEQEGARGIWVGFV